MNGTEWVPPRCAVSGCDGIVQLIALDADSKFEHTSAWRCNRHEDGQHDQTIDGCKLNHVKMHKRTLACGTTSVVREHWRMTGNAAGGGGGDADRRESQEHALAIRLIIDHVNASNRIRVSSPICDRHVPPHVTDEDTAAAHLGMRRHMAAVKRAADVKASHDIFASDERLVALVKKLAPDEYTDGMSRAALCKILRTLYINIFDVVKHENDEDALRLSLHKNLWELRSYTFRKHLIFPKDEAKNAGLKTFLRPLRL